MPQGRSLCTLLVWSISWWAVSLHVSLGSAFVSRFTVVNIVWCIEWPCSQAVWDLTEEVPPVAEDVDPEKEYDTEHMHKVGTRVLLFISACSRCPSGTPPKLLILFLTDMTHNAVTQGSPRHYVFIL